MMPKHLREKILEKAISLEEFGLNDLAWEKENAKNLITSVMLDDIGIFGGSVYEINSNRLTCSGDNWGSEPHRTESWQEFCDRSKIKALEYIERYPILPIEKVLFSIVFTEYVDRIFEKE